MNTEVSNVVLARSLSKQLKQVYPDIVWSVNVPVGLYTSDHELIREGWWVLCAQRNKKRVLESFSTDTARNSLVFMELASHAVSRLLSVEAGNKDQQSIDYIQSLP